MNLHGNLKEHLQLLIGDIQVSNLQECFILDIAHLALNLENHRS